MTVTEYLRKLDVLISAAPEIISIDIIRRSVWTTEMETIGMYRYKLTLSNGDMLELTERMIETKDSFSIMKYRHHWQHYDGQLVKRWDNANHHPDIETFPHHLHDGSESNVIKHREVNGLEILNIVISSL